MKKWMKEHPVLSKVIIILLILLLLLAFAVGFYYSKLGLLHRDGSNISESYIEDDDTSDDETAMNEATAGLEEAEPVESDDDIYRDENVINLLLIGTDERTDYFSDNARGDTCMLLSINKKTGSVKLISFERGMGVPILAGQYAGQYDWLTHTFRYGGADLMVQEIRECFKVDVERYIRVNFNTFIKGIDAIGGVDINLTEAEATYFRDGHIDYTAHAGVNHLDGDRAIAYARLREIDSDWTRIVRQRTVVQAAINQTKHLNVFELNTLADTVLPLIHTNLTDGEITQLLLLVPKMLGVTMEQSTVPIQGSFGSMKGMGGRSMFAADFDANAKYLREFLYPNSVVS